jgi:hypothetical protein
MGKKIRNIFTPWSLGGMILGILGGFLYYYKVGCRSGSCPIWSNPWFSMMWGALAGYLIGDLFSGRSKKKDGADPGEETKENPGD